MIHNLIMYYLKLFFLVALGFLLVQNGALGFTYNGFKSSNLTIDGYASITDSGLLRLTNLTKNVLGHAFHPDPIQFRQPQNGSVLSFSTTFVFAIVPNGSDSGQGLVFVIAPAKGFPKSITKPYFGMFNKTNDGLDSNHVVGVEMDTMYDPEVNDMDYNHVGIDINSVESVTNSTAGYYTTNSPKSFVNISLYSGNPIQAWVEYEGSQKIMKVTIAPINITKPSIPLLNLSRDLSSIFINGSMYVGFSSSTGTNVATHYILGWSFALNGTAPSLDIPNLPKLPIPPTQSKHEKKMFKRKITIGVSTTSALILVIIAISLWVFFKIQRKKRFSEEEKM